MENRNVLLFIALFLATAFVSAYTIHDDFEDDYYWARDYYHSDDYYRTSSLTYQYNTFNHGDDFDSFDEYDDYLFRKNHPWLVDYYENKYRSYSEGLPYASQESTGIRGTSVYYSPVTDKTVVRSCYVVPPKNSIFYIKC